MHWATAERVLSQLDLRGAHVLDPFCGSGTVLVEARVAGHAATGVDLNPLAVALSRLKTDPLDAKRRGLLVQTAAEMRARSEERVQARDPLAVLSAAAHEIERLRREGSDVKPAPPTGEDLNALARRLALRWATHSEARSSAQLALGAGVLIVTAVS